VGKRGPSGKPTQLRILHGDRKDRINDAEPVPPEAEIACPDWASDAAQVVWERLAPGLISRKVLTAWDADAFLIMCEALARYRAATQLVNGSALLVQGGSGLMKNPALVVQGEAERTFLQYAARFGLTPSDRQGIKTEVVDGSKGGADRLLS
jgi:P27 family predicted phage terminase small subunit